MASEKVFSPISAKIVPVSEVDDELFKSEAMGKILHHMIKLMIK
ncbi:hypothetical protein [Clostridium estertheticum]|nr:hypothetical protein [Clostridium estertheticum]